jgi:hypothetical protein
VIRNERRRENTQTDKKRRGRTTVNLPISRNQEALVNLDILSPATLGDKR